MTLKEFSQLYYDKMYEGSKVPLHAQLRKQFRDGSANELTNAILAYFKFKGIVAARQASEGRYLQEKKVTNVIGQTITVERGRYIPRDKKAKGSGDITVTLPPYGRRLDIEVKYGKDRQSDVQKAFQTSLESMGGLYIIVKTWQDFYDQINKLIK